MWLQREVLSSFLSSPGLIGKLLLHMSEIQSSPKKRNPGYQQTLVTFSTDLILLVGLCEVLLAFTPALSSLLFLNDCPLVPLHGGQMSQDLWDSSASHPCIELPASPLDLFRPFYPQAHLHAFRWTLAKGPKEPRWHGEDTC